MEAQPSGLRRLSMVCRDRATFGRNTGPSKSAVVLKPRQDLGNIYVQYSLQNLVRTRKIA